MITRIKQPPLRKLKQPLGAWIEDKSIQEPHRDSWENFRRPGKANFHRGNTKPKIIDFP